VSSIEDRLFLVGCARSGTTLLQSLIAAHSDIVSFPESHFFEALAPDTRWRRLLRLAAPEAGECLQRFYEDIGCDDDCVWPGHTALRLKPYARAFAATLDNKALRHGKHRWLEKTPLHLHYVDIIERYVPDVQFIHLVRHGRDVIASLHKVTNDYPRQWGGARDIETCVDRWATDIAHTRHHAHKPHHHIVRYASITDTPDETLKKLCSALDVKFESAMLNDYRQRARKVSREDEPWKEKNTGAIQSTSGQKFQDLFNDEQRTRITRAVSKHNLDTLPTVSGR
jgi:hypothetical protein